MADESDKTERVDPKGSAKEEGQAAEPKRWAPMPDIDEGGAGFKATVKRAASWPFWRTMVIYFCVFSVVGHMVEFPYCWMGLTFFGTVDPSSEVLTNPMKPFLVYGIGIALCAVLLVPFKEHLLKHCRTRGIAMVLFFVVAVFLAMAMELIQGFLQNQPVDGVYPLWDNSKLPGNILGQAWIVNDLLLGWLITLIVWLVVPLCDKLMARLTSRQANILMLVIVVLFAILMVITYVLAPPRL